MLPLNIGTGAPHLHETALPAIKVQTAQIQGGHIAIFPSCQQGTVDHLYGNFHLEARLQELFHQLHHKGAVTAGLVTGSHAIREHSGKVPRIGLKKSIIIPGDFLCFLHCLRHPGKHVVFRFLYIIKSLPVRAQEKSIILGAGKAHI